MTVRLVVDDRDPAPPYAQLRTQLEAAITDGRAADGQQLPPVRQLAKDLGLAAGTVARAYKELEQAGLVRTARGAGTRVVAPAARPADDRRAQAERGLHDAVARARVLGLDDEQIVSLIHRALAHDAPSATVS